MSHGKNKNNFKVFNDLEFIAAITQHIPEPSFKLIRYYGWYSNPMRGDRRKQEEREETGEAISSKESMAIDIRKFKSKCIPQLMWRESIENRESRTSLTQGRSPFLSGSIRLCCYTPHN